MEQTFFERKNYSNSLFLSLDDKCGLLCVKCPSLFLSPAFHRTPALQPPRQESDLVTLSHVAAAEQQGGGAEEGLQDRRRRRGGAPPEGG